MSPKKSRLNFIIFFDMDFRIRKDAKQENLPTRSETNIQSLSEKMNLIMPDSSHQNKCETGEETCDSSPQSNEHTQSEEHKEELKSEDVLPLEFVDCSTVKVENPSSTDGEGEEEEEATENDETVVPDSNNCWDSQIAIHEPIVSIETSDAQLDPASIKLLPVRIANKDLEKYKCTYCTQTFCHLSRFERHMRIHTGEKPYQCSVCRESFSRTGNLNAHMRIHSGERPFQCSICGERFTHSGNLNVHMRTHTGEKPFQCTHCPESFSRSSTLNRHIRRHTGERPFQCSVCTESFSRLYFLKTHMKTHSDLVITSDDLVSKV